MDASIFSWIRLLFSFKFYLFFNLSHDINVRTHESLPLKFEKVLVRLSLCYCFISDSCSIIFHFQLVEVVVPIKSESS